MRPRCRHASPTIRSQNSARLRDAQALFRALGLGDLRAFAVSLNAFRRRTDPKIPKEPDLAKTGLRNEKTQGIPWVCRDLSASGRRWLYCQNRRYWTRTTPKTPRENDDFQNRGVQNGTQGDSIPSEIIGLWSAMTDSQRAELLRVARALIDQGAALET